MAMWFQLLWTGVGDKKHPHLGAQRKRSCNNTLFCTEESRLRCLYWHSHGQREKRKKSRASRSQAVRGCMSECLTLLRSRTEQDARLAEQASAFLTKSSLQLVLICNSIRNTVWTQYYQDNSEKGIISTTSTTTPWLALDSKHLCLLSLQCRHQLYLRGVKLSEVENFGSSTEGFCAFTIHLFHCILNLHDTLTSTHVPSPDRKLPNCSTGSLSEYKKRDSSVQN